MRPFFIIWTGQALSLLGSQLVQFALVWWLTKTTGSATMLALAGLAAILPQVLIGPFAGVLVDRWHRKTVMLAADTLVAVVTLALAALFWLDLVETWTIYLLLLVRAAGAAFHWPAMQASTTLMVPEKHLARIGGLNQGLVGLAGIFIPPLGALAMETLPMQAILAIDVATAIPAITCLLLIAIPQPARSQARAASSVWAEMRAGLRFIISWRGLLILSLIGLVINMLGRAAAALVPLLVMQHFQGGALQLGWLQSMAGIGAVMGGITLGIWGGGRRRIVTSMLALVLDGLAIFLIGLSPQEAFLFVLALVFGAGFLEAMVFGLNGAIFQAIVPPEMQGRIFALLLSLSQGLAPLGLLLAGPTADTFGVQTWWLLTGIVISLMGAAALCFPAVVHIEEPAYQPAWQLQPDEPSPVPR